MMKNLLFLDDIRTPNMVFNYDMLTAMQAPFREEEKWDTVRDYNEFVEYLESYYKENKKLPELISFDHDLADKDFDEISQEKTGMDCAKWLVDFCIDNELSLPEYLCHSQNPAGKDNIMMLLNNFKKHQSK